MLKVLDSSSPFYEEKKRFSIEHLLNPPEIWFYHSTDYGPRFEIFLKLDGTYDEDLETGTLGLYGNLGLWICMTDLFDGTSQHKK